MITLSNEVRSLINAEKPIAMYPIRIEPEGMGLSLVKGELRHLNPVATSIYRLLDGKRTIEEIVQSMSEQYADVDANDLFEDTLKCIRELQRASMVCWKTAR
jgi:Coenzyme PQQ synthesis protein D (PqqD)